MSYHHNILLVDDDRKTIALLLQALTAEGYNVHTASSGEEALEVMKASVFGLIILDYKINDITWISFLQKAREISRDTFCILLAGDSDTCVLTDAVHNEDIYRLFTKPFKVSSLLTAVRNALNQETLIAERETLKKEIRATKALEGIITNSRDKMLAIFDSISDRIFSLDCEYNIISANKAFADEIGYESRKIVGRKCYAVRNGLDRPCPEYGYDCPARTVFETGRTHSSTQAYTDAAGQKKYSDFLMLPVKKDGRVVQIVKISRDVTKEKEAAEKIRSLNKGLFGALSEVQKKNAYLEDTLEKLKQAQSRLLQSEKMASIGQLAAGVAHEINNPTGFINSNLGTLKGYLEDISLLVDRYEELKKKIGVCTDKEGLQPLITAIDKYKEEIDYDFVMEDILNLISESREGTDRVKKIVVDLKDFSRIDRAQLEYADINRGIESTLNIVWNELKYKARVIKDLGDLPEVYCYAHKLNQVFMNLFVNAAQAIKEKGEIRVTTRAGNAHVEIKISDTGSGIPPDVLPRIFDPFFTTKDVGKGTGLGLNMAYNIIQKHNGTIDVESTVGKGTTFTVRIPVKGDLGSC